VCASKSAMLNAFFSIDYIHLSCGLCVNGPESWPVVSPDRRPWTLNTKDGARLAYRMRAPSYAFRTDRWNSRFAGRLGSAKVAVDSCTTRAARTEIVLHTMGRDRLDARLVAVRRRPVQSLSSYGGAAKVLAGGQSLVPLMNLRLAAPEALVDINGLEELGHLGLAVGALVRQSTLERSDLVRQRLPLLAEASALVGHPANRHRGTVGGSLAHADAAAELPAAMLRLEATASAQGRRVSASLAAAACFSAHRPPTLA